jgi:hypothetical protein
MVGRFAPALQLSAVEAPDEAIAVEKAAAEFKGAD